MQKKKLKYTYFDIKYLSIVNYQLATSGPNFLSQYK